MKSRRFRPQRVAPYHEQRDTPEKEESRPMFIISFSKTRVGTIAPNKLDFLKFPHRSLNGTNGNESNRDMISDQYTLQENSILVSISIFASI